MNRRSFIKSSATAMFMSSAAELYPFALKQQALKIMTVTGVVAAHKLGKTLIHEHILVDFIGAASYDPNRWNDDEVIKKVLPYLLEVKQAGCQTVVDCTPNYLGRDVYLLKKLSEQSGLNIITNTGYYGGSDNKFLPQHAFTESADQLSTRWVKEWENGIDGASVKPGFMKISVNPDHLSEISQKLVHAAARTHLKTGLTIASHTGPAVAAFEEIEILNQEGVAAEAFIWVHAQNETDKSHYVTAAKKGAWVSLDGLNDSNVPEYAVMLSNLKKENCLHRTLISHDAGWYDPGNPGGDFRGYTVLFKKLLPLLSEAAFSEKETAQLIEVNPREAFSIRVRRKK